MDRAQPKICILPQKLGLGGPASFQFALRRALNARSIEISPDPLDPGVSTILVFGGKRNFSDLKRARRSGVRVVQRLNGMNWVHRRKYTGIRHFLKAEVGNHTLRKIRSMADRIIYQSEFSRSWWERVHGVLQVPQCVIYNGVDTTLFCPAPGGPPEGIYRVMMVEGHHGGGYEQGLETGVALVKQLAYITGRPCELAVAGDVPQVLKEKLTQGDLVIRWLGVVRHEDVPALLCTAHVFFSSDINAACPNAALEAMACGLPVVAFDTGAMKELIGSHAGRVADYGGDVWMLDPPDIDNLVAAACDVLQDYQKFSLGARQAALECFDINKIADQYLDFLLGA